MNTEQTNNTIAYIRQKQTELKEVASRLKNDFIGLDDIIDQIIDDIKIWYIFPELQIRPTIICLWGLTGVGKTDLVRKMMSYMKFQDRCLEIEMAGDNDSSKKIQLKLEESSISSDDHCVLFLDEFQKFRTVNDDGGPNTNNAAYADVWTLLSDGKFQADLKKKTELIEQLLYAKYYKDYDAYSSSVEENEKKKKKKKSSDTSEDIPESAEQEEYANVQRIYKTPIYLAKKIKRLFKLTETLEDIMKWDDNKIFQMYNTLSKDTQIYEGDSYQKMLIIISGNLDEAYKMADDVSEADLDADYYHEYSKKLTVIDIKNALRRRFRPEQIARFGNSHILYPSLSKDNYYKIIELKCKQINKLVFETKGISISYDQTVYNVMYNNGVFPTQGVRPLLSTITSILSTSLPPFIFECLLQNINSLSLSVEKNFMISRIKDNVITAEIPTVLDNIRGKIDEDKRYVATVHELGHALVYSLIYKFPPKQICVNSIDPFTAGFVLPHHMIDTKESIQKKLQIYLAGRAAEEIVFGSKLVSVGATEDISKATTISWVYVGRQGFDGFNGSVTQENKDGMIFNKDLGKICENLLQDAKKSANDLIVSNMALFKQLIGFTIKNAKITSEDFIDICESNNVALGIISDDDHIMNGYKQLTEKFIAD